MMKVYSISKLYLFFFTCRQQFKNFPNAHRKGVFTLEHRISKMVKPIVRSGYICYGTWVEGGNLLGSPIGFVEFHGCEIEPMGGAQMGEPLLVMGYLLVWTSYPRGL